MEFDPREIIEGVPIRRVRDCLTAGQIGEFDAVYLQAWLGLKSKIAAQRWAIAAMQRGLIEPGHRPKEWRVASLGKSLANARFLPRLNRAKAERLISELVERIRLSAINCAREGYIEEVAAVALFGSCYALDEADNFGDVDVLLACRRLAEFADHKRFVAHCQALFDHDGRTSRNIADEYAWPSLKLRRALKARNPYISLHNVETEELTKDLDRVRIVYLLPDGVLTDPWRCTGQEFLGLLKVSLGIDVFY
jgi:predicted nucleotidyltransferase